MMRAPGDDDAYLRAWSRHKAESDLWPGWSAWLWAAAFAVGFIAAQIFLD